MISVLVGIIITVPKNEGPHLKMVEEIKKVTDATEQDADNVEEKLPKKSEKAYVTKDYLIKFGWVEDTLSSFEFYYGDYNAYEAYGNCDKGNWTLRASCKPWAERYSLDITKTPFYILKLLREALKLEGIEGVLDKQVTLIEENK